MKPIAKRNQQSICKAHKSNGQPCAAYALHGGSVCRVHGGSAPQVKAKAGERLAALVSPAIAQLERLIKSKNPATSLGAVRDILDRNGLKAPAQVELTACDGEPHYDFSGFSTEQLESFAALFEKAGIMGAAAVRANEEKPN